MQAANPDVIADHRTSACGGGGAGIDDGQGTGFRARQVFDLSAVRPEVTRHRLRTAERVLRNQREGRRRAGILHRLVTRVIEDYGDR